VDQDQRRRLIAEAVCRLAARNGLEGVSLRTVAREAGVSMGLVQHYFRTKDEMLAFAFRVISEGVERRLQLAGASISDPPSTRSMLRTLLLAMLPLDDDGRFEAPLWVAFLARAVHARPLAELLRQAARLLTEVLVDRLRSAGEAGELAPGVEPERAALTLLALADGLMLRLLLDPASMKMAVAAVEDSLDRLFC
jgi:AcrR family transcriptional regulator